MLTLYSSLFSSLRAIDLPIQANIIKIKPVNHPPKLKIGGPYSAKAVPVNISTAVDAEI